MKGIGLAIFFASLAAAAQSPQLEANHTVTTIRDNKTDDETVLWRNDLKANAWTKDERFYSYSSVSVLVEGEMRSVSFPTYEQMTGFPDPDPDKLRPRGRDRVIGWDKSGRLIYSIWRSPLETFVGRDPLQHLVWLEVRPDGMKVVKVEHQKGEWRRGDWIPSNAEKGVTPQSATRSESDSEDGDKPQRESELRPR